MNRMFPSIDDALAYAESVTADIDPDHPLNMA